MEIRIQKIDKGDLIYINGMKGYFMGFGERHGLSEIIDKGSVIIYKGFYHDNYFILESVSDYGITDYDLLEYIEDNSKIKVDDELTELINFVNDDSIINEYYRFTKQERSI